MRLYSTGGLLIMALFVGCNRSHIEQSAWWENDPKTYYTGDLYGLNLYLTLREEKSYHLVWHGCCGMYGKAEGEWTETDGVVALKPRLEDGEFTNHPIRALTVSTNSRGHRCLLLPTNSVYSGLDPMFTREQLNQYRVEWDARKTERLEQQGGGYSPPAARSAQPTP